MPPSRRYRLRVFRGPSGDSGDVRELANYVVPHGSIARSGAIEATLAHLFFDQRFDWAQ